MSDTKFVNTLPGRSKLEMDLVRYVLIDMAAQASEDSSRWFPKTTGDLAHYALCLCGEAGEMGNIAKKIDRDGSFDELREKLLEELADVFTYFLCLADLVGLDTIKGYYAKREINEKRFGNGRS